MTTTPFVEIRDVSPLYWRLSGLATTWHSTSEDRSYFVASREHTFREVIARNAFSDATSGRDLVELRRDHDANGPTYASTGTGTMKLVDADDGLGLVADLLKAHVPTQVAYDEMRTGRRSGLSVGMRVNEDRWSTWTDNRTALRTITSASLDEVSLVKRPANPQAVVSEVRTGDVEYRSVALMACRPVDEVEASDDQLVQTDESMTCPVCGFNGYADQFGSEDGGRSAAQKTHRRHLPLLALDDSYVLRQELEELNLHSAETDIQIAVHRSHAKQKPVMRARVVEFRTPDEIQRDGLAESYRRSLGL